MFDFVWLQVGHQLQHPGCGVEALASLQDAGDRDADASQAILVAATGVQSSPAAA